MKSRLFLTLTLAAALLSGCAVPSDSYCDLSKPLLFDAQATVDWLLVNDRELLTGIVTHNETVAAICP